LRRRRSAAVNVMLIPVRMDQIRTKRRLKGIHSGLLRQVLSTSLVV
jgi:hypothetical protein